MGASIATCGFDEDQHHADRTIVAARLIRSDFMKPPITYFAVLVEPPVLV
jgi:hypothetical protein